MAQSKRLRAGDLGQIRKLIGECRELGYESNRWRLHLMAGFGRLVGSTVACGMETIVHGERRLEVIQPVSVGWTHHEMAELWQDFVRRVDPLNDVVLEQVYRQHQGRGSLLTRTREQLLDDRTWRFSEHYNQYRRTSVIDSCIYSWYPLPITEGEPEAFDLIAIHRGPKDKPFGERERCLVRELHRGLGALIGRQLASAREPALSKLPRRHKQVLECLLKGKSEKEVANHLGLNPSTVHQYVLALHRCFRVASTRALLARWIQFEYPPELPDDLSSRLRDTLSLLFVGNNETQIAEALGLSKATVNQYVGMLYRRFGVQSRGELLARWIRWNNHDIDTMQGNHVRIG